MQSGDTDALRAARAKAAEVRELMKTMTDDEKIAHKQAKADEKKEKAKARYAAQKAEKLRLKEAAEELERMRAKPVGETVPPALPKMAEPVTEPPPEPDPIVADAPEVQPESEPQTHQPDPEPEPQPEPETPTPDPPKPDEPPKKPAKKKKQVILELASDSEDEVVSVKVPRKSVQLPATMQRPTHTDWRPRGQAGLKETMMAWPSTWQF